MTREETAAAPSGALGVRAVLRRSAGVFGFSTLVAAFDGAAAVVASRDLGSEGRGVFAVVVTIAAAGSALASFGVPTTSRVRLAKADGGLTMGSYLSMAPAHVAAGAVLSGVATVGLVVALLHTGSWTVALASAVIGGGLVLSSFGFEALHGIGRHPLAMACNALGSGVALVLTLALALGIGDVGPLWYLAGLGASVVVQGQVAVLLARRDDRSAIVRDAARHREVLRISAAAMPFQLSTLATFRLDRYLVGVLTGVGAAGIYSVASTLSEATRQLPMSLGQVLLFGRSSGTLAPGTERRTRRMVLALTWALLAVIGLAAPLIVDVLFGDEFDGAVGPLRILLVAEAALAVWFIDNRLLVGSGRFAAASKTTMVSAVVVVAADLLLIPPFELTGAAAASVIAYTAAWWSAARALRRPDGAPTAVRADSAAGP